MLSLLSWRCCREQAVYKFSAIAASLGVTVLAIAAVHYRFTWHARQGGEIPYAEAVATFLLTIGGVVSPLHTPARHCLAGC